MVLYMYVTNDIYELPICVAESVVELSKMVGISPNCISSSISHQKSGRNKRSQYIKVKCED